MKYTVQYSEYMEYEDDIEATSIADAKKKFEEKLSEGSLEPQTARIMEYNVDPDV